MMKTGPVRDAQQMKQRVQYSMLLWQIISLAEQADL
jgi:hypothetical protein